MRESRRPFKACWAIAIVASGVFLSSVVCAGRSSIRVGEVRTASVDSRLEPKLRALLKKEVDRIGRPSPRHSDAYVLSASLVSADLRREADTSTATCVISATLRREHSGTLVAMMRGSGTAEDDANAPQGALDQALAAAVRGAVVRVPEAL